MRLKDREGPATAGNTRPSEAPFEGGDLIVHYLQQIGVEYVFGVPGGAIEPLVNAIARGMRSGGPKLVVARHESGAAFMADGYARETGKLGVCFATTGPGATNMITGVANAYQDGIPLLAITAQTRLENFGRGGLQESSCTTVDTVGIYKHYTNYNSLVSHPKQLERKLISAILAAFREPGGAVHLSLPLDVTRAPAHLPLSVNDITNLIKKREYLDKTSTELLWQKISAARKVVFVIGEGARGAIGRILALALRLDAAVVATPFGKGLISPYHSQFRGIIGMAGHSSAVTVLSDPAVDCIIAVGTSLGEFATANWNGPALLNHRLIHIDAEAQHFSGSPMAQLHVHSSPEQLFEQLDKLSVPTLPAPHGKIGQPSERATLTHWPKPALAYSHRSASDISLLPKPNCVLDEPEKYMSEVTPIKPQRVMRDLPALLPPGTRFVADATGANFWAIHYLHVPDRRGAERRLATDRRQRSSNVFNERSNPPRRLADQRKVWESLYRCPGEFGSMGWGIGAGIGTAFGSPEMPVVVLTGDGSMLMNGQEITVALQHQLTVIFAVLNDRGLGTVKHGQRLAGAERIGFELPAIDFAAMASAMGVEGCRIRSPEELQAVNFNEICRQRRPYLLDILIDAEEVLPLGGRMKALEAAT
ncbi:thiamine pyrophosphate-binding protein [Immundisolibacter sp.]